MSPIFFLKLACGVAFATGLASIASAHPAGAGLWGFFFDLARLPLDGAQGAFSDEARLLNAIHGGVLAGWAVLLYWHVSGPLARGEAGARQAMWLSITTWVVLDSLGSVVSGWPGNLLINGTFYAAFALPLLALGAKRAPRA